MNDIEDALGYTFRKVIDAMTCPACLGVGKHNVDSGGVVTYTCESCRGTGLLHPIVAARVKERMAKMRGDGIHG